MNNNILKEITYIIIAILLGIITIKFIVWLIPIILIILASYYIYKLIKKNKNEGKSKTKKKNKPIKIIDMVEENK